MPKNARRSLGGNGPEHQRQREDQQFEGENFDYYVDRKTGWRYREPRWNPSAASSSTSQWQNSQWQASWSGIPQHLIHGDFGSLEGIPEHRPGGADRTLTGQICAVQFVHEAHRTINAHGSRIALSSLCLKRSHLVCHMPHPWLFSRAPSSMSTSSSSPSYTTQREHSVHPAHLQAPSVDKLRHQESLWREDLQSGGNPRTTTPTGTVLQGGAASTSRVRRPRSCAPKKRPCLSCTETPWDHRRRFSLFFGSSEIVTDTLPARHIFTCTVIEQITQHRWHVCMAQVWVAHPKWVIHPRVMCRLAPHSTLNTSTSSLSPTSLVLLSSSSPNPDLLSTHPPIHCEDPRQDGTSTEYPSSTGYQPKRIELNRILVNPQNQIIDDQDDIEEIGVKPLTYSKSLIHSAYDSAQGIATSPDSDLDDEQLRKMLASPLDRREREENEGQARAYHSERESLTIHSSRNPEVSGKPDAECVQKREANAQRTQAYHSRRESLMKSSSRDFDVSGKPDAVFSCHSESSQNTFSERDRSNEPENRFGCRVHSVFRFADPANIGKSLPDGIKQGLNLWSRNTKWNLLTLASVNFSSKFLFKDWNWRTPISRIFWISKRTISTSRRIIYEGKRASRNSDTEKTRDGRNEESSRITNRRSLSAKIEGKSRDNSTAHYPIAAHATNKWILWTMQWNFNKWNRITVGDCITFPVKKQRCQVLVPCWAATNACHLIHGIRLDCRETFWVINFRHLIRPEILIKEFIILRHQVLQDLFQCILAQELLSQEMKI